MIVIIDNYDAFAYSLYDMVAQITSEVRLFRNDKISVEGIQQLNPKGIILSSGVGALENTGVCMDLIDALSAQVSFLGVNLGCHLLARYFGANIIKTKPIHAVSCSIKHNGGELYKDIISPFSAGQYHAHSLDKKSMPLELTIEAEKQDGTVMSFKHVDYPCYGVQYHPESILTSEGHKIINNFCLLHVPQQAMSIT